MEKQGIAALHYRHFIEDVKRIMLTFSVRRQQRSLGTKESSSSTIIRCSVRYKFRLPADKQALLLEKEEILSVVHSLRNQKHKEYVRQRIISLTAQAEAIAKFFNKWLRTESEAVRHFSSMDFQWVIDNNWMVYCFIPPLLPRKR